MQIGIKSESKEARQFKKLIFSSTGCFVFYSVLVDLFKVLTQDNQNRFVYAANSKV